MIPHWDLIPGEDVTLTSQVGTDVKARFLFRDTISVCFQLVGRKDEVRRLWFKHSEDGHLRDALHRRWHVKGERETTRMVSTNRPNQPHWKDSYESAKARGTRGKV